MYRTEDINPATSSCCCAAPSSAPAAAAALAARVRLRVTRPPAGLREEGSADPEAPPPDESARPARGRAARPPLPTRPFQRPPLPRTDTPNPDALAGRRGIDGCGRSSLECRIDRYGSIAGNSAASAFRSARPSGGP